MILKYYMSVSPGLSQVCPWERDHLLLGHTSHLTGLGTPAAVVCSFWRQSYVHLSHSAVYAALPCCKQRTRCLTAMI